MYYLDRTGKRLAFHSIPEACNEVYNVLPHDSAGKSTTMSILAGLLSRTRGTVTFEGGIDRPPRGTIGLVPQKNVLFPELTCYQTLRLWKAIKTSSESSDDEDIEQLLRDCDLGKKIHYNANALSGGQKRKLQLAIGLIGGSKSMFIYPQVFANIASYASMAVSLVGRRGGFSLCVPMLAIAEHVCPQCTSGVDPLSRRALWRTLTSVRHERTVVFTTHVRPCIAFTFVVL